MNKINRLFIYFVVLILFKLLSMCMSTSNISTCTCDCERNHPVFGWQFERTVEIMSKEECAQMHIEMSNRVNWDCNCFSD